MGVDSSICPGDGKEVRMPLCGRFSNEFGNREPALIKYIQKIWFLFALLACFVVGINFATNLEPITHWKTVQQLVVASVMFMMAWPLATSAFIQTIKKPGPILLASMINMLMLPLLAKPLSMFFSAEVAAGFVVMSAVPSTLASAAVWTRRAGGNDAVAVMTTIVTNGTCFLVTPMWVWLWLGVEAEGISFLSMVGLLSVLVVLPMALAQATRRNHCVAEWASRRKVRLGQLAQVGILFVILVGATKMGLKMAAGDAVGLPQIVGVCVAATTLHFGVLVLGLTMSRWMGYSRGDQIGVGFAGSQKTLMVGLVICTQLEVSLLPMVVYHALQLIGDTPVADYFRKQGVTKGS